jgi:hypothetical protein
MFRWWAVIAVALLLAVAGRGQEYERRYPQPEFVVRPREENR